MELLDEIKERLSIFNNLYDALRIVDPVNKRVITVNNDNVKHFEEACYGFWNKSKFCENCISIRAYNENDTCVKIECKGESILLIIATPVSYKGETYILELLKDISKGTNNIENMNDNMESMGLLLKKMGDKLIRDELTGLYNRRYITERLPVDINKSSIEGTPLSIIMTDIDLFKYVNDTYGHVTGDRVLKDFADLISESIDNDLCWTARYGGEEFIIVLNNTDINTSYELAEKIRKKLEEKIFVYDEIHINITSSFGVYSIDNKKVEINDLIDAVDRNLYKAKQSGRNIVIK
ncbi:MAG: diguanylate cyclase [Clostridiales bacterium]|jgi:diguanylate cyclase (GGDEF)-like protein|nr:diguanylate cyclase [Clostridiales bacterium]